MTAEQTTKKILIWGGKSQARLCIHQLTAQLPEVETTIFDATVDNILFPFNGQHISDLTTLKIELHNHSHFIVAIGGEYGYARATIGLTLEKSGLTPLHIIHPNAFIGETVMLGKGIQIMPQATINEFTQLGDYCIINTSATIDHECSIGNGVHVMGSAAIAGRVTIDDFATVGTNATILPDVHIGRGAYVGAGAVVTKDVAALDIVVGVPAKKIKTNTLVIHQEALNELTHA